jgi:hypothetical protein
MPKPRDGFHNFQCQLPDALWERLAAESDSTGEGVVNILIDALCKRYGVRPADLPGRKRPGRKPGS